MKKVALFAFNGELLCFVHVMLNALDMQEKGYDVRLVFEGASVKLIPELAQTENMFHKLYLKLKESGVVEGACKACSHKLEVADAVKAEGIAMIGEMMGHPAISEYMDQGYEVITF
ncbi:DsrE family protein [Desulfovibrio ferrophilus]|uniref:Cytoplasmic protein n=1 Tax=Desulfovibrio ferrophilus TaxID=241368 RepID=A0A2Z6AXA1_9BACT|nr:DsrE family protein [Desulfovibrio ferrophilus]BBD07877.1 cytoplasmic protein [Desulfovibrio ferrophilus]